ncbi:hypothetical protein SLEP1_g26739 [Rubroshorea leprosula]|uniref:Uncharacterized protein n=1 Tax=Rubroshorea leprosula TaxID=152421 RepID=A0AAV5JN31_9ROSI|nr:hypothetical protein SLEP1_g26739 [Rubroshorea leprosula]
MKKDYLKGYFRWGFKKLLTGSLFRFYQRQRMLGTPLNVIQCLLVIMLLPTLSHTS